MKTSEQCAFFHSILSDITTQNFLTFKLRYNYKAILSTSPKLPSLKKNRFPWSNPHESNFSKLTEVMMTSFTEMLE